MDKRDILRREGNDTQKCLQKPDVALYTILYTYLFYFLLLYDEEEGVR